MKVQVNGRNVEVNDYLRDYVTKKVGKLERYLPQITEVRAELTQNMTPSTTKTVMKSATMVISPCENTELMFSMSLMVRVVLMPMGVRSK